VCDSTESSDIQMTTENKACGGFVLRYGVYILIFRAVYAYNFFEHSIIFIHVMVYNAYWSFT